MRSKQDRKTIKSNLSDPYTIKNFISQDEINNLIDFFESSKSHIQKNTGPLTLDVVSNDLKLPVFKNLFDKIKQELGSCDIFTVLFFKVEYPHIVHNDDSYDYPVCYKGINLPLRLYPQTTEYPKLCFFDQYYLEGPANFFNGSTKIDTYYNACVYEYSQVYNLSNNVFDENIAKEYLSHLNPKWLEGLSFNSAHEWKPGNAIIFDTVRLHCASDFRKHGIKSKLGLSIFTKL